MEVLILVRICGGLFVGIGSWMVGRELERKCKMQWELMQEMKDIMVFLEAEMTHRRNPVETSLGEAAGLCHTQLREVLLAAAEEVNRRNGMDFSSIWREQLELLMQEQQLTREQQDVLCACSAAMCGPDITRQQKQLETCISHLERMSAQAYQVYREKSLLYRRLSTACGVFLIILLI